MIKLFRHPLFLLGLCIRVSLMIAVVPTPVAEWFAPFLETSIAFFSLDPWAVWVEHGGSLAAFPYGYVQWLLFLPATAVCALTTIPVSYAYFVTLLAADAGLLCLLRVLTHTRGKFLLFTYWLSPIIIFGTYFLGLNDILPIFLLILGLFLMREKRFSSAGFFCVCAVSAKLSMLIATPFFLLYFLHNKSIRRFFPCFLQGAAVAGALFILPFLFSTSGKLMLLSNPELHRLVGMTVLGSQWAAVQIVPLAYILLLYAAWRVKRLNYHLFEAMLGVAFFVVIMLMPASLGWFIWVTPFLILYQCTSDRAAVYLTSVFSLLYLAVSTASGTIADIFVEYPFIHQLPSMLYTTMTALGVILCIRMWRESIRRNDFFRLSQKPFVIGIAGDSGAGKTTLSENLEALFGKHSVTSVSGDDYHHWDRKKPMWKVLTHLNPMANNLEAFAMHIIDLIRGKSVQARHYNHATGHMTKPAPLSSNDIIIVNGLHALYMPLLRQCYDVSIYLDIDESLRRYFKIRRDVRQRGHSLEKALANLESRERDAACFICPQAEHADLLLALHPVHPERLADPLAAIDVHCKLVIRSRHMLYDQTLRRVLIGMCGLRFDVTRQRNGTESRERERERERETILVVEGECSAEDIAKAAHIACPQMLDFLDLAPQWQGGIAGVMQLVVLAHINQTLRKQCL